MTKDKTDSGHLHAAGILEKVNKICSLKTFAFKLGYLNLGSTRVQILIRLIFRLGYNLNVFRN